MSKANYQRLPSVTYHVECSWEEDGITRYYTHITYAKSDKEAIESAYECVLWSKHPTFRAKIGRKMTI